jgi:hypothetical protein
MVVGSYRTSRCVFVSASRMCSRIKAFSSSGISTASLVRTVQRESVACLQLMAAICRIFNGISGIRAATRNTAATKPGAEWAYVRKKIMHLNKYLPSRNVKNGFFFFFGAPESLSGCRRVPNTGRYVRNVHS